jgi:hypothetical protein
MTLTNTPRTEMAQMWAYCCDARLRQGIQPGDGVVWIWDREWPLPPDVYAEMMRQPLPFGWAIISAPRPTEAADGRE